jgi:glyoxylase-like metal-dependent hydrolase (beta-lactamase superfamily II)
VSAFTEVAPDVHLLVDSCNVYVVQRGGSAIAVDFGTGAVLDALSELGIERLDAVLMTHHHRDQGQGLPRAVAAGIPIWVPPVERELFERVDEMWATRTLANDYNLRQDRFSLLQPVPIAGTVPQYRETVVGGVRLRALPTPGHTMGSVSYLLDDMGGGGPIVFSGDLIAAPGKVWSLAATQWSYTESEGPAMTVLSALALQHEHPALLLPSHGEPMHEPDVALGLLAERMNRYVDSRRLTPWDLTDWLEHPYTRITEHLLINRSANSCSYVLLDDDGHALFIDYGYDVTTGWPAGTDRAARLPWLASLPALRRDFDVRTVEVALATHYHDDHVAGLNLLREVEGTEVWLPEHVAPIMADPLRTDLPCQWFDPIPADRVLPLGGSVEWRGYGIVTHDLPGHTRYQAAFEFEVDGVRVLATGDQQTAIEGPRTGREILNYQYRNRFRPGDYQDAAALYRRVAPGLFITGHWRGRWVDLEYLDQLATQGDETAELHEQLLLPGAGPVDGNVVLLEPFYRTWMPGERVVYTATVHNPGEAVVGAEVALALPDGWTSAAPAAAAVPPRGSVTLEFEVTVGSEPARRQRLAADLTLDGRRIGQVADAVADVRAPDAVGAAVDYPVGDPAVHPVDRSDGSG